MKYSSFINYKGCKISRTSSRLADTGQRLCEVTGRFNKAAGLRPFLPSFATAKRWVTKAILSDDLRNVDLVSLCKDGTDSTVDYNQTARL